LESHSESTAREHPLIWSLPRRVLFRFCVVYFPLFFLTMIPNPFLSWLIPRMAVPFLPEGAPLYPGGSDTVFDYLRTLLCLVLALIATLAWSALDSRRPHYEKLHRWFRYLARLLLVFALSTYGWDKIFLSQMPPPGPDTLVTQLGRLTPYTLLWSTMGASRLYQMFSGVTEVLSAGLLMIPRMTLGGALLGFGIMTNVFVLNMGYGVPVKILSFHLLLLSVVLIAPDIRRLADFFLRNRSAAPSPSFAPTSSGWPSRLTAGLLAAVALLALPLNFMIGKMRADDLQAAKASPIYGVWSVDELAEEGGGAPHFAGASQWVRLIHAHRDYARIELADGSYSDVSIDLEAGKKTLDLADDTNTAIPSLPKAWKSHFSFERPDGETLILRGAVEGTGVRATFHRVDVSRLPLATARFHWTSDRD
jgi:hypothetical protein